MITDGRCHIERIGFNGTTIAHVIAIYIDIYIRDIWYMKANLAASRKYLKFASFCSPYRITGDLKQYKE